MGPTYSISIARSTGPYGARSAARRSTRPHPLSILAPEKTLVPLRIGSQKRRYPRKQKQRAERGQLLICRQVRENPSK